MLLYINTSSTGCGRLAYSVHGPGMPYHVLNMAIQPGGVLCPLAATAHSGEGWWVSAGVLAGELWFLRGPAGVAADSLESIFLLDDICFSLCHKHETCRTGYM